MRASLRGELALRAKDYLLALLAIVAVAAALIGLTARTALGQQPNMPQRITAPQPSPATSAGFVELRRGVTSSQPIAAPLASYPSSKRFVPATSQQLPPPPSTELRWRSTPREAPQQAEPPTKLPQTPHADSNRQQTSNRNRQPWQLTPPSVVRLVQANDDDLEFTPRDLPFDGPGALGGQADPDGSTPKKDCRQTYRQRNCCEEGKECLEAWQQVETNLVRNFDKSFLDITPLFKPDVSYRVAETLNQDQIRRDVLSLDSLRTWKNAKGAPLMILKGTIYGLNGDAPPVVDPLDPTAERATEFKGRFVRKTDGGTDIIVRGETGQEFTFPLDKLSLDDQYWVNGRPWQDLHGRLIAHGRLEDYKWGRIYIRTREGRTAVVPLRELGEDELCYVDAYWGEGVGVPTECRLHGTPTIRNFTLMTYTWKASALCHKPLYFEEVQLERYGHSAGPLVQPVISGAHFFGNIAVLPYKMGLHPPTECVYALGYFRPGSCAPYMIPPVPFSVRAGLMQAGAVVGTAAILP